MAESQRGQRAYSLPDAQRHRVRLSGVTVPRHLLDLAKSRAEEEGTTTSAVVERAMRALLLADEDDPTLKR